MKLGCKVIAVLFLLGTILIALFHFWWWPAVWTGLHGGPNRLTAMIVDGSGAPVSNAVVHFEFHQRIPVLPLPSSSGRTRSHFQSVTSDAVGAVQMSWPNATLGTRTVSVSGISYPVLQVGGSNEPWWHGYLAGPTPDGKSTWAVSTTYTARIVLDSSNKIATVHRDDNGL
jgi:hypothetical protein